MLGAKEERRCYPGAVMGVNVGLACVSGAISFIAFYQIFVTFYAVVKNTFKKFTAWMDPPEMDEVGYLGAFEVVHLMIGSSNLGYFLYFMLSLLAACKGWICWSHSCGFVVMALPKILLVAAFLLLLSFWVDLCHQSNDDDEEEGYNTSREALLEKVDKTDTNTNCCRRCCVFWFIHIGNRQKIVILVTVLLFALTLACAVLVWICTGKSLINSNIVAQVYVDLIAVVIFLLGGALACYGLVLVLKMKIVRSEQASSEMWKVAGLAIVCVVSFTSSSLVAIVTNIPLFYHWNQQEIDRVYTSLLLVLYYIIGSSVPSAFILFVMKELPPPLVMKREEESRTIAFITEGSVAVDHPQRWTAAASMGNQVSRASPI